MDADLFLQQFGHLAQGEGGIDKLRALIYVLASKGELIKSEANARRASLPQISEFIMGQAPAGASYNDRGEGTVFVKVGEFGSRYPRQEVWTTEPQKFAKTGDVLICVVGATIGKLNLAIDCAIGRSVAAIRPNKEVDAIYLYYSLMPYSLKLRAGAQGSAQGVISRKHLSEMIIRLPSLPEQKRIVAKVDELMALCDKLEAEQKTQRTLKTQAVQSTLHHLTSAENPASFGTSLNILERTFGNWFDNLATVKHLRVTILQLAVQGKLVPKTDKWKSEKLGDRIELISGQHLKPDEYTTHPKGIPYITGPADFGEISPAPTRWTLEERSVALPGDVLVTVKGSGIGKTNIVTEEKLAISRQLMAVRVKNDDSSYIHIILKMAADFFQSSQVGIAIPGIGRKDVLGLSAVFPPLAEQKRIVTKVNELMTLCDQLEAHITHTQTLNTHLMDSLIHRMTETGCSSNELEPF